MRNLRAANLLLIAVLVCLPTPSPAQGPFAGKPIPNGPDVKTNGAYREGLYQYYLQLVDHYKLHTKDPEPVQEAGIRLLTAAVRARCLEPGRQDFSDVQQLGQEAIDAGSTDLLVRQRYARLRAMQNDFDTARATLLECEADLDASGYPPIVALLNSFYLCALARSTSDRDLLEAHFPVFQDRFAKWARDECQVEGNRRYVFDLAYSMTGEFATVQEKQAILESLEKTDGIDAWFLDTFTGAVTIDIAWLYRTGGWANSVDEGSWQRFGEQLDIASERLQRAWRSQPDYPEAPALMISIAMAGNASESPRAWFDRAVAAEMDYPWAYYRLTNAMLPRWGGSHQAMSRFGLECLATKRFDTLVPLQLFTQVQHVENETGRTNRYFRSPKVYAKLREMFRGYREQEPQPELQDLFYPRHNILSANVAVALLAEHWEDSVLAIEALGSEADPKILNELQVGRFHIAQAYAMTGPGKESILEAERVAEAKTVEALDGALELLSAAADRNSDERAAAFFTGRIRNLSDLRDYQRGEWVSLQFDDGLSGWRAMAGQWERESDDSIIGSLQTSDSRETFQPFILRSEHGFQPPFQLHIDVEDPGNAMGVGVGVAIGTVSFDGMQLSSGRFCYTYQGGFGVDQGFPDGSSGMGAAGVQRQQSWDLRVWPASMMMFVDQWGPYSSIKEDFQAGQSFSLAGRAQGLTRGRFHNLRIRKLPYAPLPELTTEQLVSESAKMIEFDPDDWYAYWSRGAALFDLEKYDEALVDFQQVERLRPTAGGSAFAFGATYAKTKNYAKAVEYFKQGLEAYPNDARILRFWAEMEMTAEDPQYRDLQSALARANQALGQAASATDYWRYQLTVAEAHAALGDYTRAVKLAAGISAANDPEGSKLVSQRVVEFREKKRNSYKSALAALLWEGDITARILGLVLGVVLLAANLIVIRKVARFGRLPGALAGMLGVAISLGIPCLLAVLFGLGEGPAFLKLLGGIVGASAVVGLIGGACTASMTARSDSDQADSAPIAAQLAEPVETDQPVIEELEDQAEGTESAEPDNDAID